MDFQLTEEQKMLQEMVHNFVMKEIASNVSEWDEKEKFVTDKIIKKYVQSDLVLHTPQGVIYRLVLTEHIFL